VHSEEEALRALYAAESARTTAEHALNARSNRAHCILTVHLQQRNRLGSSARERILSSKLHCVDLAGSERLKKTMGVGPLGDSQEAALQKESMAINKSLATLESVVTALANGLSHVPYRSAKLTTILKDALGGGPHPCSSVIIACIWGEARHLEETLSTLRLAHRWAGLHSKAAGGSSAAAAGREGEAVIVDAEELLQRLARENAQLRQELQMHGEHASLRDPREGESVREHP
jgi:kinesin family protein 6/9